MGCCFSLKTSGGLPGERSALLQPPHHDGLSQLTEELRQHAAAVAQHVCLDEEQSRGTCEESTRRSPSPRAFCRRNLVNAHQEKLDGLNTQANMEAQTGGTRGAGLEKALEGSRQVWSPPSDTEASGDRRGPKGDPPPGHADEARLGKTAPSQGFQTKSRGFYSTCSIEGGDLEAPAAGGAAALPHTLPWREVEDARTQAGPARPPPPAVPPSDPPSPASSLRNVEQPSRDSPPADFAPEEPPVTSLAAPGTSEGGAEGLRPQREEELEQNLDSGFTGDHPDESEPPAGWFPTAPPEAEASSQSSSSVTFSPPRPNSALSPSPTGPASPQGERAPPVVPGEVEVRLGETGGSERGPSERHRASEVPPLVSDPQDGAATPPLPLGDSDGPNPGEDGAQWPPAAETFPDQAASSRFESTSDGCRADPGLTPEDPAQVDAHASTPSYLIHCPRPEQDVAAQGGGGEGRMREMVSELLGDDADLPACRRDPEPWIKLGQEQSRRAWAQGEAEEVLELLPSMALLGAQPYSTALPQGACVWDWHRRCSQPGGGLGLGPDSGLAACGSAEQEPRQPWTRFSNHLSALEGARLEVNASPVCRPARSPAALLWICRTPARVPAGECGGRGA